MKEYSTPQIRNVVLLSHGGNGKTSLVEAMAFDTGATTRLGRVDDGTTLSDYDPDEIKRRQSINLSVVPVEWRDCKCNLLDAPGYVDFIGEAKCGARAADAAILLADATAGTQVGTEVAWRLAAERSLPRAFVVNRMDRENADFDACVRSLRAAFGRTVVPVQIPIGAQDQLRGVVDLVSGRARLGEQGDPSEIPGDLTAAVQSAREQLIETAAEADDDVINKYLEGQEITDDELERAVRAAVRAGVLVPVFATSATRNVGVRALLDAVVSWFPSPADSPASSAHAGDGSLTELACDASGSLAALVFKTTADPFVGKLTFLRVYSGTLNKDSHVLNANKGRDERIGQLSLQRGKHQEPVSHLLAGDIGTVAKLAETVTGDTLCLADRPLLLEGVEFPSAVFAVAVAPKSKSDQDKLGPALQRIVEEDPTLRVERDPDTSEMVLSGLGESHVEVAVEKMQRKFGVGVETRLPRVPYRETAQSSTVAEYKHKKQTGGAGQYGHVFLELTPLPRGSGFEFTEHVVGGAVPREFFPAVEKGVREALRDGVIAHCPVVDLRVTLTDGSSHPVDSKSVAFEIAAAQAFRKGLGQANPVLLEPVMRLRVVVPSQFAGDVISDLNTKRAHVSGMTPLEDGSTVIEAEVPRAEVLRYATDLRSITQGRGSFALEFSHYAEVPQHLAQRIAEQSQKEHGAEKS